MGIIRVLMIKAINKLKARGGRRKHNLLIDRKWMSLFVLSIILLIISSALTGCAEYHTFSSRIKQLDFTFEYPRGWRIAIIEQYSDFVYTNLTGPNVSEKESAAKASFDVHLGKGEKADQEAQRISKGRINADKDTPNFNLIRQETANVDGYKGYLVEYTYDHVSMPTGPKSWFFIPTHVLDITIPKNGMVYEIWLSASQNEWNAREKDFQHILNTFRWK